MTKLYKSFFVFLLFLSVTAEAQVNAGFIANSTIGCNPMVVQFTNLSSGNPTSYLWNFGNGNTSTLQNPSATYTVPGSYTVTLTVSNATASNTKTLTNYITVYPAPVADFIANDTAGCPPHSVIFTDQSTLNAPGAGTYAWDFGTGSTVTGQNATYTFQNPGYYAITHVVISAVGCTTTVQKPAYIHVYTPPVADFATPFPVLCGPGTVAPFNNGTTGVGPFTCFWDFGDGGTSQAFSPSHAYASLGSYTVTLVVTDANGCKDTLVKPNYIQVTTGVATFTSDTAACQGSTLSFVNTTPFTLYCNWDFGDGTNDTNQNTVHTYNTPGTYTVSLVTNNGTCMPIAFKTIVIHPLPNVDFSANILTPCPAPALVQFTNLTANGDTYLWDFGDGTTSTQVSPGHNYLSNGSYNVTLTANNNFGCTSSIIKLSYINIFDSYLSINVTPGEGCIPLTDSFSVSLLAGGGSAGGQQPYPATITSYSWNLGDGTTSTLASPVHTYTDTGIYMINVLITTSNGCTDSASYMVRAGTPPVADFFANPIVACVNQPIQFQNNSVNANEYTWSFGDGTSSSAINPLKEYEDPGTYSVTLIASNNGCKDTIKKLDYILVNFPKADFLITYQCDTLTKVQFNNTSLSATSFTWFFGDGTFSSLGSPAHIYPALGTYNTQLVAYNDVTGCTDTLEKPVNLFDTEPNFIADDTAVCLNTLVSFTSMVTNNNFVVRYDWIFDNIQVNDTTSSIQWTYYTPGWHNVSLIVTDAHNCKDTFTKNNCILVGHPAVDFIANDTTVCAPAIILFTNTSTLPAGTTIANMEWFFASASPIITTSPTTSFLFNGAGAYGVKLIVTDNIGCVDSLTRFPYIEVHDPIAGFTVNSTNACLGAPIPFFSQSLGVALKYLWNFGDGTIDTVLTPQHIYTQTGTYTVSLIVTDNYGCTDTIVKPNYITVYDTPVASFTLSDTFNICPPLLIQVNNTTTGGYIYNWNMGDGSANTAFNPSHIYLNPGVYTVSLVAINLYGCKDTAYAHATLLGYNGAFTYTPLTGCAPLTVSFHASMQNVPGFVWDFSDGTTLATTDSVVSHTYLNPGPVIPRLIMTDNAGCASTSYGLDTIKVDGVYSGFTYTPYPACNFGTLSFLDTSHGAFSTVNSRLWTFHDGQTSNAINPSKFYPTAGAYVIKLYTTTNTGCLDTLTDTLNFYPLPVIDAGPDTTICMGDSTMMMPSGGVSYTWSPATDLSCINCTHPFASPVLQTLYTLTGTDINGCSNTDTVRIKLKIKTESITGQGGEICEEESLQLMATGANTYEWTPATWLNNAHISNPVSTPQSSITYTVIAYEGSCIPDTNFVNIIVHAKPNVDAGPDQTIIAGEIAQLSATGANINRFEWAPDETLNCNNCAAPEATPKNTTDYRVVVYSDFGCTDSDKVTIFVVCDNSQVFMPNSFTPNNDGQNDKFYPRGKGIKIIKSFRIYNRWGELVFEQRDLNANDRNIGWDGTYKGVSLNPDVFIYIVDAICDTGEPVSWKGDISLIR